MKNNKKYLSIIAVVVILCVAGIYVYINKKDIFVENKVAQITEEDEILNENKNERNKEEGKKISTESQLELAENLSDKNIRAKHNLDVVIAKINKIEKGVNVHPVTKKETMIMTLGKMQIISTVRGSIKENQEVNFMRPGGKMNYYEYLQGSEISREKLANNPEMDIYTEQQKKNMIYEDNIQGDVVLEEGKTYMMYIEYNEAYKAYNIRFMQFGTREVEKNKKSVVKRGITVFRNTQKNEENIRVKNNETGEYENIEEVI